MDVEWLYMIWVFLLLILLCVRVWVCIIKAVIRHERDQQTDSVSTDDPG